MMTHPKDLLTAREVAQRIGIAIRTVWRLTKIGQLPAPVRLGRQGRIVRWKTTDIDYFVQNLASPFPNNPENQ